ncbi:SDR family oxidoreductase [Sulfuricurvum sp. IAE1]|uniref:UDP-2-acetamido-2,6-beta-L-arabino-hexul-4-ose reductase n=1 Tax=Sulfuricurvum sp. IAE1 TaxID=2546102 RepID=UPI001045CFFB|nr:NAD-dependent epimerase/dehydratase family protein [Sulfuricurvum sp. IAE1]TDA69589.1 SDR family oxidoreductase [Sulfuricurvum sp. IAE1]
MRVLVTGGRGFIAQNLIERLGRMEGIAIDTFVRGDSLESLHEKVANAAFVFHLAGINRPEDPSEFYTGNRDLTAEIVQAAAACGSSVPILMSSSIQAERDNDYGKSKREGEEALAVYAAQSGAPVYIYRLPNVFGKWSRPNYNTVIATWCHNITRNLPIQINDPSAEVTLVYIDDVVDHFVRHLDENGRNGVIRSDVAPVYKKTLGEIHDLLLAFRESRENLLIPNVGRGFERALYATYLSFLPTDRFSYTLGGHQDERGTFYEFIKFADSGQVSISTTAPGITRGNHYHNTKNEKFLVIKGEASIKLRQIHGGEVIEYRVSDRKMEIVEMIPGYTHDITNTGDTEMVLLLWANEIFDRDNPDTYFLKV